MEEGQEFSGKTVEEATEDGLAQMGLTVAQAEIEILSRGSRGIFGIGSEPARVRISRRASDPPATPPAPVSTPASTPVQNAESIEESNAAPATPAQTPATAESPGESVTVPQADGTVDSTLAESPDDTPAMDEQIDGQDDAQLADLAEELLADLVRHMGFDCSITAEWRDPADDETERYLHLDIQGNDLGALIGRRGETLAGIQYLIRLMINQRIRQWKPIVVDVENYKERRNNQLTQLALRMAQQVIDSGRAMSLEPMPANERRIVHLTLRDHPQVYTQSSGEGERRKVHIVVKE